MKKKVKKYADGGLAGIAQSAQSLMSDVNNMSKRINYGSGDFAGGSTPQLGFLDFQKRQQSLDAGMSDKFSPGPSGVLPGMRIQATDRIGSFKKGGSVKTKKMASGGKVSSASKRADGCATKGKTKGRII